MIHNNVDLKSNVIRDRNFNTPYYSNPYGYLKNVFSSKPDAPIGTISNSPIKKDWNRAFNNNTKTIFSPLATHSSRLGKKLSDRFPEDNKLLSKTNTLRDQPWNNNGKMSSSRIKVTSSKPIRVNASKEHIHSQSVDMSSSVKNKTMNSTFTSGFASTMGSTGFKTSSSFKNSFYSTRGEKTAYTRGYGKYKLKETTPTYDFTGGDTPWINKVRVNNKILGQEQNFKINHTIYDKEFDSARPIAHTKARKFCSMTRFIKDLEDNRIFQRWRMSAYRASHR